MKKYKCKNKRSRIILFVSLIVIAIILAILGINTSKNKKENLKSGYYDEVRKAAQEYAKDKNLDTQLYYEVTTDELVKENYLSNTNSENVLISFTKNDNNDVTSSISTLSNTNDNIEVSGFKINREKIVSTNNRAMVQFNDDENEISITNSEAYGFYQYNIEGLVPNQIYVATANITTTNMNASGGAAMIGYQWSDTYTYFSSELVQGNVTNKEIKLVFMINNDIDQKFYFLLGLGMKQDMSGYDDCAIGDFKINSLTIERAEDDEDIVIGTSKNNLVREVYWKDDYEKSYITSTQYEKHLSQMEEVYNCYKELVGETSYSDELLYPNLGDPVVFMFTNILKDGYGAIAGIPIQCQPGWTSEVLKAAKIGNLRWGPIHEFGHVFTLFELSNDDYTNNRALYNWDSELWGSTLPIYALDKTGYRIDMDTSITGYEAMTGSFENTYNNVLKGNKQYANDAVSHLLFQGKVDGKIDWEAWKETFKWFNDLDEQYLSNVSTNTMKFLWFIKKLDNFSSADIRSNFNDEDLSVILNHYNSSNERIESIVINNEEVNSKDGTIDLTITPDRYDDIVVYSTNSDDFVIDDFGNCTINGKASTYQVTVSSFLNPDVTTTKTVKRTVDDFEIISDTDLKLYDDSSDGQNTSEIEIEYNHDIFEDIDFNFEVENEDVVEVDNNIITAIKPGKTKVIVSAGNIEKEINVMVYKKIRNRADLESIEDALSGGYELENDIDLSDKEWTPIGTTPSEAYSFTGIFDGQGHNISGLNVSTYDGSYVGLFGHTMNATIKNLHITSGNINVSNAISVGALVGRMGGNGSRIENVSANVDVKSSYSRGGSLGGIIGMTIEPLVMENCYNSGNVSKTSNTHMDVGGLIGKIFANGNLQIHNCFNSGTIISENGSASIGGLVGSYSLYGKITGENQIKNCYNVGQVKFYNEDTNTGIGGIIGYIQPAFADTSWSLVLKNVITLSDIDTDNKNGENEYKLIGEIYEEISDSQIIMSNSLAISPDRLKGYRGFDNFDTIWTRDGSYPTLKSNPYTYITEIKLNNEKQDFIDDIEINNGETERVFLNFYPNSANKKDVDISVENSSIASVNQINESTIEITANQAGTTNMIIKTKDGTYIEKKFGITVTVPVENVELNKSTLTMDKGTTDNSLVATVSPSNATEKGIIWTSDNEDVVRVNSSTGELTAVNEGTATITATTLNGQKTAICIVTVVIPLEKVEIENVDLSSGISMVNEETIKLTPKFTPEDASINSIEWTSNNPEIVEIDESGIISAKGIGTATINLTVTDRSGNRMGIVFSVTVEERVIPTIPVESINLNKTELTLTKGNNETLVLQINPNDANVTSVEWKSSDENVATVDANGNIVAKDKGTALITVTVTDADGNIKETNCSVTVIENVIDNEEDNDNDNENDNNQDDENQNNESNDNNDNLNNTDDTQNNEVDNEEENTIDTENTNNNNSNNSDNSDNTDIENTSKPAKNNDKTTSNKILPSTGNIKLILLFVLFIILTIVIYLKNREYRDIK